MRTETNETTSSTGKSGARTTRALALFLTAFAASSLMAQRPEPVRERERDVEVEREVDAEEMEREAKEQGEKQDHAVRRAQAFRDMYADEFGRVDPEQKLRAAIENQIESRKRPLAIQGTTFTNLGPTNSAGRVSSIAVDPTNAAILYRGTAGGGVWKSTNGGTSWVPLTDSLGDLSVGAVAVAPTNASIVYVGTGEGAYGSDAIDGIGFIKSTDGGNTWTLPVALSAKRFFDLSVNPTNANDILAATDTGLQRSTNGGASWTTTFPSYVGTGLARIPGTPLTVVATLWAANDGTWRGFVYRSVDGGSTWTEIAEPGLAGFDVNTGRMSIAASPSAPSTVYVLAAAANMDALGCPGNAVDQTGFYRSTDAGRTFTKRSNPVTGTCGTYASILGGQGWYANVIKVDPANANVIYAGGLDTWKSTDGGATFSVRSSWFAAQTSPTFVHADDHAMVFAGTALLIGNDGGINKTTDGAANFTSLNTGVVTRQYYAIGVTAANKNLIIGGAQDNGTNVRTTATTSYSEVIGGDGFGVAAHPTNASILYGTVYDSRIFRSTDGGATFPEVTPTYGQGENAPFISPLTIDPNNGSILYTGTNFLWKTTNGGTSWFKASTTDLGNGLQTGYLTKIAVARANSNYILTATGDGSVRKSTDGGRTFTAALAGGLPSKFASHVEFDRANVNVFYVTYAGGATGGRIYKTTNGGTSFTQIDAGIPSFPVHVLRVDPTDSNALYAGSDLGLFRSTDGGTSWARFGNGLPAVSIWDVAILPDGSLLRVATHGRGFWELAITGTGGGSTDTTKPTTSITAPANGATVSGNVNVTATASDNVGVTKLEIYVDGVLKSSNTNAASLTFAWATTSAANGTHTLTSQAYDAAGNVGVSATVTVTVSNTAAQPQQLLGNRGFENGASMAPWTGTPVYNSSSYEPARTGSWNAWLGGYGYTATDTLQQQVTIPASITSATLSFWLHIDTNEATTTTAYDTLRVQVRSTSGAVLATLATYSNLNWAYGYQQRSFNLLAWKGQTVVLTFVASEDVDTQTSFALDDTSLDVQ